MSVDELAGKMEGCIAFEDDDVFCGYNHKQAEALILADRKEMLVKVKTVLQRHVSYDPHGHENADGFRDGIIHCTDKFRADLAGVLEETK
jgi:hypothetical protein